LKFSEAQGRVKGRKTIGGRKVKERERVEKGKKKAEKS